MDNALKIYTDGGARGNPGPAASAYVVIEDSKVIHKDAKYLGVKTNNEAEYKALSFGLALALESGIDDLDCYLDSELVVKQLKGLYKVKNSGLSLYSAKIKQLETKFKKVTYIHIKRELNKQADKIVNEILDRRF